MIPDQECEILASDHYVDAEKSQNSPKDPGCISSSTNRNEADYQKQYDFSNNVTARRTF